MKKAIILAIITVCLVSFSVVFYYKQTDFSNGGEQFVEEKNVAQVEEKNKESNWFNLEKTEEDEGTASTEEDKEIEDIQSATPQKDLSICN